eukprot:1605177-Rhodomonas_salina.2
MPPYASSLREGAQQQLQLTHVLPHLRYVSTAHPVAPQRTIPLAVQRPGTLGTPRYATSVPGIAWHARRRSRSPPAVVSLSYPGSYLCAGGSGETSAVEAWGRAFRVV